MGEMEGKMIEMVVDSIRVSVMNYQRVVILKEKDANRYLPIWIGPAEADAIAIKLQNVSVPRPLTHDLLYTVIESLGALVNFVFVDELRQDTFYAKLYLKYDGKDVVIDCRPSDAIALAVRAKAPIYVAEEVLEKAGIYLDRETGKPVPPKSLEQKGEIKEEELKKLSPFWEVIKDLNLDDLDKGKS